jgi:hypothetical protein
MVGMIFMNIINGGIDTNIIYNTETKFFYLIYINDNNQDDDEIRRYTKEEIPEEQKKNTEIFLNYYQALLKKRKKIENKDENSSFKEQNSFSQSNQKSEQNSLSNESSIISQNRVLDKSNLIYVRNIINKKEASILFLSDQTKEAIFKDKIKILISEINKKIQIINKDNEINVVSANNIFENSNNVFIKRIQYIKNSIFQEIKSNLHDNIKENNQN